MTETREEKVARLRAAVRDGSYRIPSADDLAEAMLERAGRKICKVCGGLFATRLCPCRGIAPRTCLDCGVSIRKGKRCARCCRIEVWRVRRDAPSAT